MMGALEVSAETLRKSYEICRDVTRHHAKSFYFSSHTLPLEKRKGAYAIYAFCREADDAVDLAENSAQREQAVREFRERLALIYQGTLSGMPGWVPAFAETVRIHEIPSSYFEELLEGMVWDQGRVRLKTWAELERYCYLVAGVVGVVMTHLFTKPRPELLETAKDLGTAMQLTNILRDIKEDWERDRIYLPEEERVRFGIKESDFLQRDTPPTWRLFLQFQIDRAREYYLRSEQGIVQLPPDGSRMTVWMMRTIYAEILNEIEKADYQVLRGRVRVSMGRKLILAAEAWGRSRG